MLARMFKLPTLSTWRWNLRPPLSCPGTSDGGVIKLDETGSEWQHPSLRVSHESTTEFGGTNAGAIGSGRLNRSTRSAQAWFRPAASCGAYRNRIQRRTWGRGGRATRSARTGRMWAINTLVDLFKLAGNPQEVSMRQKVISPSATAQKAEARSSADNDGVDRRNAGQQSPPCFCHPHPPFRRRVRTYAAVLLLPRALASRRGVRVAIDHQPHRPARGGRRARGTSGRQQ